MLYLVLRSSDVPSLHHTVPLLGIQFSSLQFFTLIISHPLHSNHSTSLYSLLPYKSSSPTLSLPYPPSSPTLLSYQLLSSTPPSFSFTHFLSPSPLSTQPTLLSTPLSSSLPTAAQGVQLAMRQLFSDPVNGVYANGRTSYGPAAPGSLGMTSMCYTFVAVETVFCSLESLLMFS